MRRFACLLTALAVTGCASLPGSGPRRAGSSGRESAAESSARGVESRDLVAELQREAAKAQAEITLLRRQLAALKVEVERLAAREVSAAPPPPSRAPSREVIEQSELPPVRVEAPPPLERAAAQILPVEPAAAGPVASGSEMAVPLAAQTIYDRGYTLYHQGRYLDAESSFQRFLQVHSGTELADNAQFWIGESRFARQDFMGAMLAFQEVVDRFPSGNKVADSLLKVGDCLGRLDDPAGARDRFEQVVERFPGSAAAVMAQERLGRRSD